MMDGHAAESDLFKWPEQENVAVVINPSSRRHQDVQRMLGRLAEGLGASPEIFGEPLETVQCRKDNIAQIHDRAATLSPSGLLIVAAGDGTVNHAVEALSQMQAETAAQPDSPGSAPALLVLPGGNGNDFSRTTLDPASRRRPARIPGLARIQDFYPLHINIQSDCKPPFERRAACYFGLGFTACGANALNGSNHRHITRGNPFDAQWQDARALGRVLRAATPFRFAFKQGDEEWKKAAIEMLFPNGRSLAGKLPLPGKPYTPEVAPPIIAPTRFGIICQTGRLATRRACQEGFVPETMQVLDNVAAHVDGETFDIPAGAHISITSAGPLRVITTKSAGKHLHTGRL